MGKKNGWFSSVKKAFSPEPKEKKEQKTPKSKKKWFGKQKKPDDISPTEEEAAMSLPAAPRALEQPSKITEVDTQQEDDHSYNVAVATAAAAEAAEAAVAAAQAVAEVVRLTSIPHYDGRSKEEIAAIKIQTAFRGYLARRALRALRGLVRLKTLIEGQSVKRQATTTLRCMQILARLQSQISSRRIRMSEENQALQKQLQLKHEKELEKLRMDENWDDSAQSKEQIEASFQSKQDAALRRERAMAYAYSHQKKNSRSVNSTFMDPNNPHWGWSWLERWMAARPWETRSTSLAEKDINDHGSVKSAASRSLSVAGGPSPGSQRPIRPSSRQSPGTHSRTPSTNPIARTRTASPKVNGWAAADDDTKSMMSMQSYRRHSIAGSSVRDDESLASSPSVPSYMAPTKSAKAKTKLPSPLGGIIDLNGTTEKVPVPVGTAKKRLSFPASPGPRRHSVPGKIESTPNDIAVQAAAVAVSNGGGR